jgi:hypothetical protein
MTVTGVSMQPTDLYPAPKAGTKLAVRKHIAKPAGAAQFAGCEDGQPAVPSCINVLAAGAMPVLPAVGGNITNYGYWSIYEPAPNGAYFVGEVGNSIYHSVALIHLPISLKLFVCDPH